MTEHVSAMTLDALALGSLPAREAAAAEVHLASCARCRGDRDAATELRAHFTARVLSRTLPRARRVPRWWWLAVPAFAAAAAVLVIVLARPHRPLGGSAPAEPDLAIKGDAAWQVIARRADHTFAVHDGTKLAAGDRVRFVVVPGASRYLMVASIDGSGVASIYFPWDGEHSALVKGPRAELPDSVVLDDAPGPERLFALFSDQPLAASDVRARLRELGAAGADAIRAAQRLDVPASAQLTLVFEKEPR